MRDPRIKASGQTKCGDIVEQDTSVTLSGTGFAATNGVAVLRLYGRKGRSVYGDPWSRAHLHLVQLPATAFGADWTGFTGRD